MSDNLCVEHQTELIPKLCLLTPSSGTFLMIPSDLKVFQILLLKGFSAFQHLLT